MTRAACVLAQKNVFTFVYLSVLGLAQLPLFVIHDSIFRLASQASAVCYSMARQVRFMSCSCIGAQSTSYLYLWSAHSPGQPKIQVKGAATLCNRSVWEPRLDGFAWGWDARLVPSKAGIVSATTRLHWQDPSPRKGSSKLENHLLASLCNGQQVQAPARLATPQLAYCLPK